MTRHRRLAAEAIKLADQATLAGARFTYQNDDAPSACQCLVQFFPEACHVWLAPHERRFPSWRRLGELGPVRARRSGRGLHWLAVLIRHRLSAALQDLVIERLRLRLRLGPKLSLERRHAELILAEGRASPPGLGVDLHQHPVGALLQRIELKQPQGSLDSRIGRSRSTLVREKPSQ